MADPGDKAALADIREVVFEYLDPAMTALKEAAVAADADAVRALALEIAAVAGSVVAACPRPRAVPRARPRNIAPARPFRPV